MLVISGDIVRDIDIVMENYLSDLGILFWDIVSLIWGYTICRKTIFKVKDICLLVSRAICPFICLASKLYKNLKNQVALGPIAIERTTFVDVDKDNLDNNLT